MHLSLDYNYSSFPRKLLKETDQFDVMTSVTDQDVQFTKPMLSGTQQLSSYSPTSKQSTESSSSTPTHKYEELAALQYMMRYYCQSKLTLEDRLKDINRLIEQRTNELKKKVNLLHQQTIKTEKHEIELRNIRSRSKERDRKVRVMELQRVQQIQTYQTCLMNEIHKIEKLTIKNTQSNWRRKKKRPQSRTPMLYMSRMASKFDPAMTQQPLLQQAETRFPNSTNYLGVEKPQKWEDAWTCSTMQNSGQDVSGAQASNNKFGRQIEQSNKFLEQSKQICYYQSCHSIPQPVTPTKFRMRKSEPQSAASGVIEEDKVFDQISLNLESGASRRKAEKRPKKRSQSVRSDSHILKFSSPMPGIEEETRMSASSDSNQAID